MEIGGTLIWYYKICPREVWLMYHDIVPDQKDDNIDYGRFLHEKTYKRNEKEILFGNVRFDVIFKNKNKLIIGETKKTSKYAEASKYQLAYYLLVLEQSGILAEGQLLYPEEKKRVDVVLTDSMRNELEEIQESVEKICNQQKPPVPEKISFCKNCGYKEYCYS